MTSRSQQDESPTPSVFPYEILDMIASESTKSTRASLARVSRAFQDIVPKYLYRDLFLGRSESPQISLQRVDITVEERNAKRKIATCPPPPSQDDYTSLLSPSNLPKVRLHTQTLHLFAPLPPFFFSFSLHSHPLSVPRLIISRQSFRYDEPNSTFLSLLHPASVTHRFSSIAGFNAVLDLWSRGSLSSPCIRTDLDGRAPSSWRNGNVWRKTLEEVVIGVVECCPSGGRIQREVELGSLRRYPRLGRVVLELEDEVKERWMREEVEAVFEGMRGRSESGWTDEVEEEWKRVLVLDQA